MPAILAVDFDGVIVDSIDECFERSADAYGCLGDKFYFSSDKKSLFYEYRYLVGPASNFVYLCDAIKTASDSKDKKFTIQQSFNKFLSNETEQQKERRMTFANLFFSSRELARSTDQDMWLSKHKLYQQIVPIISNYCSDRVFVATMKDSASAVSLLEYFKIKIPPRNVLGSDFGPDKAAHISEILKRTKAVPSDVTFIDDNATHLIQVADFGVNLGFATWGYGKTEDCVHEKLTNIETLE
jgi:phosphoglycolate phosphatase-like HAD superfamily hydrolase